MEPLCQKCFLQLAAPSEADPRDEKQRLLDALPEDFGRIRMALPVMRQLHSVCREGGWQVTVTLSWTGSGWEAVNLEPGDTSGKNYGICVDLGSTTICMRLVDLSSGRTMGQVSAYNRQIAFGEDILTRVFSSKDSPQTLEALRQATLDTFREALEQLEEQTGYPVKSCGAMTVAGNTTMMHFLFGLDAFGVFAAPYAPCAMRFDPYPARDAGIPLDGYLYCYPCRANYLGGDIISGLIATGLIRESEICVFLDIGTNGELVVGNREFLMAGAGAAGPALEGGVVKTGMRAVEGAVSYVRMEGEKFYLTVIGGGAPKGVCGSGIVDLIAQLYLNGKIDLRGKFIPESGRLLRAGTLFLSERHRCIPPDQSCSQHDGGIHAGCVGRISGPGAQILRGRSVRYISGSGVCRYGRFVPGLAPGPNHQRREYLLGRSTPAFV